ncbi:ECF RNA polymerase sigma factor SigK [Antrihabitans sp. NCIMB 15449]|uniref:ECF RNA polymerase sigma factor SigK n=1 Tax=Antrihabitans spumae TaxID=3373370 RepID=A0ABW7JR71_9NOCA
MTDRVPVIEEQTVDPGGLLADIASGRKDSFAHFYDLTVARVYGTALKVLRDPGFAQDTTQEVFLQVWRDAHRYDPAQGSVWSWVAMLAHRRAVDRVRAESSASQRDRVHAARGHAGVFDHVSEDALDRIERDEVRDKMARLSGPQREAIELAYFGGCTYREVSEALGVALPTVKSRIREGLIRMRGQRV